LTRFIAAIAFVAVHATIPQMGGGWFKIGAIGVDAVMVFFVLSGLVIAYVSAKKETAFEDYAVAGIARLWSVLLPALAITYVVDGAG
jgi:peptidoglycan/LPS O-acetylase OafA/YrhL